MLTQLSIKNFALIDDICVEFVAGLNALTGETGAGKSILIDALRLVLGERMEVEMIRDKDCPCVIEAVFSLPDPEPGVQEMLASYMEEGDESVILRREILLGGKSKTAINGRLVNVSALREIGRFLMDFHGHYDNQQLFDPSTHVEYLDRLAGIASGGAATLWLSYKELYHRYQELLRKREALTEAALGKERELDLLRYQIREIEGIGPAAGEDFSLLEEKTRLAHAQALYDLCSEVLDALDEKEDSASALISAASRKIGEWQRIDPSAKTVKGEVETLGLSLEEIIRFVQDYRSKLSFDGARLREVEDRLDGLEGLKRKYGTSLEEVLRFFAKAKEGADRLENSDVYQRELDEELEEMTRVLRRNADALTEKRAKKAVELGHEVEGELRDLGIKYARFECRVERGEFGPRGQDRVEFHMSPNAGEDSRPLADIASSGEASRILLALKRALMKVDSVPTLVFDEIDANIGGRLGRVVGEKLRQIAGERQVLLITHLPQIASFADRHIKVSKKVERGRTRISYEVVEGERRVEELAHMMAGEKESRVARTHAEEMLKLASR